ncbi:ABC transporter permease [Paenilisteria rocourtiae]|uniref:ABC-2 type transport system permease protein n=1 Tax=Listeria rocourtiae TaxID=647910 RepID=A0A4R6ZEH8_9LIST|nr:ABC transporter permease [Listeria rocourtiae]EUJ46501.1 ABC transporter permease [Listeria rocourtiae FSL F6-920]TDR50581.1 ABC-2 type transport system permease protein [Listeria rocourtiae]
MNNMRTLFLKEQMEQWRSLKWVWLPVVFAILGMMQPLMMYYLPQIMGAVGSGGSEQGEAIADLMGGVNAQQVMAGTLSSQFDQLGIIILIVAWMGAIISEKNNGMLAFILTRPVKAWEYILAKWCSQALLAFISLGLGYFAAYYYVFLLYGEIEMTSILAGFGVYFVWLLSIISIVLFLGIVFRSAAVVAIIGAGGVIILELVSGISGWGQMFNPAYLSANATSIIMTGDTKGYFVGNLFISLVYIVILLALSISLLTKKSFHIGSSHE